jgi:ATP-dependent exoDNAse (exonuclease V) alpha subunit
MIPVSDATAQEIAKKMASGELDVEGAKNLIREQAKARYTWAETQLQQGVTMRDLLLPSRDALAQEWEMSAEKIDLLDPKVQQLLTVTDKNGQVRMANGAELQLNARQSDNFSSTTRARELAATTAAYLRNYMEHG